MATFSVLPETLDILIVQGDELSVSLDFGFDLTGYSLQTDIIRVLQTTGGNVVASEPSGVNFFLTVVNLENGEVNLSLQESETSQLSPGESYRWLLRWVAPGVVTRTVLSGTIATRTP
jgi:hypothetical protein